MGTLPLLDAGAAAHSCDGFERHARRQWQTFQTRQVHDAPDFVRTFGTVVQAGNGPLHFRGSAVKYAHRDPPPNCARGKVVAFSCREGWCQAVCYQVSDHRTRAHVVACCNATAAAAAAHAIESGRHKVAMRLELPGEHVVSVDVRISGTGGGASQSVVQTWRRVEFSVLDEARMDGRMCTVCASPLNNYFIIHAHQDEVQDFPITEAVKAWKHFGLASEPLLSRIAIVSCTSQEVPRTKFFTCGEREHPSAPLTGLALLTIAAQQLGWSSLASNKWVQTPAGLMPLPRVRIGRHGTACVEFPRVIVDLDPDASP